MLFKLTAHRGALILLCTGIVVVVFAAEVTGPRAESEFAREAHQCLVVAITGIAFAICRTFTSHTLGARRGGACFGGVGRGK